MARDWYKDLQSIPLLTGADFLSDNVIKLTTSVRDFTRNENQTSFHTAVLVPRGDPIVTPAQELSQDVKLMSVSPSGKLTGILRQTGDNKRFVEVWANEAQVATVEVTDTHDDFYTDDFFGTLVFSPSETSLIYQAEAKAPKSTDEDRIARFRYKPSLGEALFDRYRPTLYRFRWDVASSTSSVRAISITPGVAPQVHFFSTPSFLDENFLVAVGHELTQEGHLPSVRWCHNRPIAIWKLALDTTIESDDGVVTVSSASLLSDPARAGRSPRVLHGTDGGPSVVWLDHARGGAHASCSQLVSLSSTGSQASTLTPYVADPAPGAFPGLYIGWGLLQRPFLRIDEKVYVVSATSFGTRSSIILIDANTPGQTPHELTPLDENLWSYQLLATDGKDRVLCSRSSLVSPPQLVLGQVTAYGETVSWQVLWQPPILEHVASALKNLKLSILPVSYPVETIVLQSRAENTSSGEARPLLSLVHGGPHGVSSTAFSVLTVAFALEGYTVSQPNYTGSVGYGGKHVDALIGRCGSRDVQDVLDSINVVVDSGIASFGKGKQFYYGGSHGGFLGAHLVGQHPDVFSAAVLPNPVINALPAESDIPDWYFEEFLRPAPTGIVREQLPPDVYTKLYAMSPLSHAANVRTPILLLIGLADHRVSNTHGFAFYHALKAKGAEVDALTFPGEGHGIEGVEEARAVLEASLAWFRPRT